MIEKELPYFIPKNETQLDEPISHHSSQDHIDEINILDPEVEIS